MSHVNTMGAAKIMEDMDNKATNLVIVSEEDMAHTKNKLARRPCWFSQQ